jgi:hypothetical protein
MAPAIRRYADQSGVRPLPPGRLKQQLASVTIQDCAGTPLQTWAAAAQFAWRGQLNGTIQAFGNWMVLYDLNGSTADGTSIQIFHDLKVPGGPIIIGGPPASSELWALPVA